MGKKILVAYASTSGNTEAMAAAIAEGARQAGAAVDLANLREGEPEIEGYDVLVFGSPAMGSESLEEEYMEPFFSAVEGNLAGRNIALFGSYDWGYGQWLADWAERARNAGAKIAAEGLKINLAPDAEGLEQCREFGAYVSSSQ